MWQTVVIVLIGIGAAVYVVRKLFRLFKPNKKGSTASSCCGCSGCSLKDRSGSVPAGACPPGPVPKPKQADGGSVSHASKK